MHHSLVLCLLTWLMLWAAPAQAQSVARALAQGEFAAAVALLEQTAPGEEYARLLALAQAYHGLGQDAGEALRQALALARDDRERSTVQARLSENSLALGDSRAALENAQQALSLAGGDAELSALARNALGNALAAAGQDQAALAAYQAAETRAPGLKLSLALNRAQLHLRRSEAGLAATALAGAEELAASLPADYASALLRLRLARLAGELAASPGREDWLRTAYALLRDFPDLNHPLLRSYAAGYLGRLYAQENRDSEALALFRRALFHAHEAFAGDALYLWQAAIGRLENRQGHREAALSAFREAMQTLQSLRSATRYTGQLSLREDLEPLYLEMADLLLRLAEQTGDMIQQQEYLKEARDSVEQLKAAELQDYYRDGCVAQAASTELENLEPRTAVLYPIVLPQRLVLLAGLDDGIRQFSLPVPAEQFEQTARSLRRLLETRAHYRFVEPAQQLYRWLIAPLEPLLAERAIDTLVVVPGGPLRLVPLAALHDGQHFLLEKYAVVTSPGLRLTDPRALPHNGLALLLAGLSESVQGFAPLPNVPKELAAIHGLYGGTLLTDQTFSSERLREELAAIPYNVVHLASHGQFGGSPAETFLLTYDGRLTMDRLEELLRRTRLRKQPVELLVLSACQTAAGDERAALGLAGVGVKAGARSALASLWFVDDDAAARLISGFYRVLHDQPGLSKAQALQQAQLALLRQQRFYHPIYWAPFLIIGNWL